MREFTWSVRAQLAGDVCEPGESDAELELRDDEAAGRLDESPVADGHFCGFVSEEDMQCEWAAPHDGTHIDCCGRAFGDDGHYTDEGALS